MPTFAALDSHRLEGSHTAFVACPPGFDALPNPNLFFGQSFVKQGILFLLGRQRRCFASQKGLVVTRPIEQPSPIDFPDSGRQVLQKRSVMRDKDQRLAPTAEKVLEPQDRRNVEVVGRLVKQQHVGFRGDRAGQQHATFHAAGERFEHGIGIELHAGQGRFDGVLCLPL